MAGTVLRLTKCCVCKHYTKKDFGKKIICQLCDLKIGFLIKFFKIRDLIKRKKHFKGNLFYILLKKNLKLLGLQ